MARSESAEHDETPTVPAANAWVFLDPAAVPERWRDRGTPMIMVPLTPAEAQGILEKGRAAPGLDPLDEPLARLLARGASTEAVAEVLRVSRRTAQRRIAGLRRRLGARSKAELERLLAARGF